MGRQVVSVGLLMMASAIVPRATSAQSLIVPEHVISEPILWIGSETHTSCGYHIHSMVLREPYAFDYDLQFILMMSENISGEGVLRTLVGGRVYKSLIAAADPQSTAVKLRPTDLYIAIPGVPDIVRFEAIEPGTMGTPLETFSGFPVKTPGAKTNMDISSKLMQAVVSRTPLLVSFVMDSSSSGTHIVRVVDNLTIEQEDAVSDCLDRLIHRAQKLEK